MRKRRNNELNQAIAMASKQPSRNVCKRVYFLLCPFKVKRYGSHSNRLQQKENFYLKILLNCDPPPPQSDAGPSLGQGKRRPEAGRKDVHRANPLFLRYT
jgi:hypothetical protein